jgi:hypothetical protein
MHKVDFGLDFLIADLNRLLIVLFFVCHKAKKAQSFSKKNFIFILRLDKCPFEKQMPKGCGGRSGVCVCMHTAAGGICIHTHTVQRRRPN